MASSGVYTFAPDLADFVDEAFERCGVDPATLGSRHFKSSIMSLNLLFSRWANLNVNLFVVDEQTQTLTDGTAGYTIASATIAMLGGVIRRSGVDTVVNRISREQYMLIPDKTAEGLPTQVFHDRKAATYTLWQVPENSTDVFRYWRVRQIQSAITGQETPDAPFRWWEALASGLAECLSLKYAPDRFDKLEKLAAMRFIEARTEDRERADTSFGMGGGL